MTPQQVHDDVDNRLFDHESALSALRASISQFLTDHPHNPIATDLNAKADTAEQTRADLHMSLANAETAYNGLNGTSFHTQYAGRK